MKFASSHLYMILHCFFENPGAILLIGGDGKGTNCFVEIGCLLVCPESVCDLSH